MKKIPDNYPEEYIFGEVIFFGKKFAVNENVLIPRLETEVLVRRARNILKEHTFDHVLDVGSGSGIIGTSVANLAKNITFVDISPQALQVAKQNFTQHFDQKQANFILSNLLENISFEEKQNILLLANLPYIKNDDWENMSKDTIFEPKIALFGGEITGFELYEKLFEQIIQKNLHGTMIIEFGFDQRHIAEEILQKFSHWKTIFFADYRGIERFAEIVF